MLAQALVHVDLVPHASSMLAVWCSLGTFAPGQPDSEAEALNVAPVPVTPVEGVRAREEARARKKARVAVKVELPDEIWDLILRHVSPVNTLSFAMVCKG